ncbi:MAG TPA: HAMP domain-containing sensor histidine kinase [Solirubrobacteraceae bacterium]|jgi:signal transduction histidine kinase|nr:HAMP domain-containing sensor histidine kinase [Solirubrobacteraceae bacterium]
MRLGRHTLRARLIVGAVAGAAIALAVLITAFNLVLDARLRTDADNVLRERATTVLRGLGTVDGRLSVIEAPDLGAVDAQTWIFDGERTLEQPSQVDPRNRQAVLALALAGGGFRTVDATDTRLLAVPVRQGTQRLGSVIVGASVSPYESTASSALLGSIILGLLILAAIAALSLWLISHALRPVAQMTAQAADWGEHDLSRRFFTGEPNDELTRLASVFDGLLARLGQSLRREQRLTAEISHELRTPLSKILAETELAGGRDRSPQEHQASLQLIGRHARDLQRVLETLLASARTALSEGTDASDAATSAARVVERLDESLAALGKSIELVCQQPVRVALEGEVLERILSPLLENAARFARERIRLDIRAVDGDVVFEICDDGPGVDPRDRERIFDPGYRSHRAHADMHPGTGLGLSLVRRLARAAGGEVEARASSNGGSFAVRLPAR